ncbi:MAG TPA: tetratricopeptide repeat protein, partial [Nitrosospira sp.]
RRQPFEAYLWAQFDLVLANLQSGRHQEAAEQAQILVNLLGGMSPAPEGSASAWSLLGIARARLGQGNQAVQALRRAALDDPSEDNWLNLTRELMEISNYADAISVAKEAIGSKPASYALHLRLGAAQLAAGQYTEAESTFRALVEAGDPLPTSYVGLAQVLLREGRAQDAANELAAAKQRVGQTFLVEYFLGLSLDRAGKRTEAIAELREAIRLNPRSSEAYLALGKSELALRREKEAIADLEEALRLNPGHVQARRLLSQAYRKTGDLNNAAKYAETSNNKQPAPEGDLLGDFLLPGWQVPPEDAGNGSKLPKRSP